MFLKIDLTFSVVPTGDVDSIIIKLPFWRNGAIDSAADKTYWISG